MGSIFETDHHRRNKRRKHKSSGLGSFLKSLEKHEGKYIINSIDPRRKHKYSLLVKYSIFTIALLSTTMIMQEWKYTGIVFTIFVIPLLIFLILRWGIKKAFKLLSRNIYRLNPFTLFKYRKLKDDANGLIIKALKAMDTLPCDFNDEAEANKQLYINLKLLKPDILLQYEPRYNGSNIGDVRIGNIVIEGKLDLFNKHEVDRLIGQIEYCCTNTPFNMKVVIYGNTTHEIFKRINSIKYYKDRVSIITLHNAKRKRK